MLRVLIIDDDPYIGAVIREALLSRDPNYDVELYPTFEEGCRAVSKQRPDVVISDWYEGPQNAEEGGRGVWSALCDAWFCPVIFYSAFGKELIAAGKIELSHPFVRCVPKGLDSDTQVADAVGEFTSHALAMRAVTEEVDRARHAIVRDAARVVFASQISDDEKVDVLRRSMRRRLSAALDDAQVSGSVAMFPWEQFLFPPISDHCMTGDLIKMSDSGEEKPENFRLVLTPTCDLVKHGGKCRAEQVLVARCEAPDRFVSAGIRPVADMSDKAFQMAATSALNESQRAGLVLLPKCPGLSPMMVANLKQLDLIAESEIGNPAEDRKAYTRVASIDSPYREFFVTWSQLQITCRPGIPPRDTRGVVEELMAVWKENQPKKNAVKRAGKNAGD